MVHISGHVVARFASALVAALFFVAAVETYVCGQDTGGQPPTGEPQEPPAGGIQEPPKGEPPKPEDEKPKELTKEEAKAKLDSFKKRYNAALKDERARADAVKSLEGALHADIIQQLGTVLLGDKSELVCAAAAEILGSLKDKRAVPFLAKGIQAHKKHQDTMVAVFESLGKIAQPSCVESLARFLRSYVTNYSRDAAPVVESCIYALGQVRDRSAVEELIKSFELTAGVSKSEMSEEEVSVWERYGSAFNGSLNRLTGQAFREQKDWRAWWNKNAKTFRFETETVADPDTQIARATEALKVDPRNSGALWKRGMAYYNKGNYDAAIADFSTALQINPRDTFALLWRGNARLAKRDFDGAIADYTEALKVDSGLDEALRKRASARREKGDVAGAVADWEEAARRMPPDSMKRKEIEELIRQAKGQ